MNCGGAGPQGGLQRAGREGVERTPHGVEQAVAEVQVRGLRHTLDASPPCLTGSVGVQ